MADPERHPDYNAATVSWGGQLNWQPWAKRRPRISKAVKGRNPRTHQDPEDAAAEKATREALVIRNLPIMGTNVWLSLTFYRASRQVVDLDNLEKHFCDAANGVLWADDSLVTWKTSRLMLDPNRPRTVFSYGPDTESNLVRDLRHKLVELVDLARTLRAKILG